jgi:transcriptional regulator of acetoin/glycerol metabolism
MAKREMNPIKEMKRNFLIEALKAHSGNRSEAARQMGVSKKTVHNWIFEFDLKDEFPPMNQRKVHGEG